MGAGRGRGRDQRGGDRGDVEYERERGRNWDRDREPEREWGWEGDRGREREGDWRGVGFGGPRERAPPPLDERSRGLGPPGPGEGMQPQNSLPATLYLRYPSGFTLPSERFLRGTFSRFGDLPADPSWYRNWPDQLVACVVFLSPEAARRACHEMQGRIFGNPGIKLSLAPPHGFQPNAPGGPPAGFDEGAPGMGPLIGGMPPMSGGRGMGVDAGGMMGPRATGPWGAPLGGARGPEHGMGPGYMAGPGQGMMDRPAGLPGPPAGVPPVTVGAWQRQPVSNYPPTGGAAAMRQGPALGAGIRTGAQSMAGVGSSGPGYGGPPQELRGAAPAAVGGAGTAGSITGGPLMVTLQGAVASASTAGQGQGMQPPGFGPMLPTGAPGPGYSGRPLTTPGHEGTVGQQGAPGGMPMGGYGYGRGGPGALSAQAPRQGGFFPAGQGISAMAVGGGYQAASLNAGEMAGPGQLSDASGFLRGGDPGGAVPAVQVGAGGPAGAPGFGAPGPAVTVAPPAGGASTEGVDETFNETELVNLLETVAGIMGSNNLA
eukprot:jgi/Mesvir1/18206/Mv26574-RA.1